MISNCDLNMARIRCLTAAEDVDVLDHIGILDNSRQVHVLSYKARLMFPAQRLYHAVQMVQGGFLSLTPTIQHFLR